jgi:hypothetical protein
MKWRRWAMKIAALVKIFGAALLSTQWFLLVAGCNQSGKQQAGPTSLEAPPVRLPPANAPIVVRGGSVEFIAPENNQGVGWTASGTAYWMSTSSLANNSIVSITGYNTQTNKVEEHTKSGLSANWKITLVFRDSLGHESDSGGAEDDPQKVKFVICSASDCNIDPQKPFSLQPVYLHDPGNGTSANGTLAHDSYLDGEDLWRYDVLSCTGTADPPPGSLCDHLFRMIIHGFNTWDDGTGNPATGYLCKEGVCDIGVGPV